MKKKFDLNRKRIVELWKSGVTLRNIAKEFNVSTKPIHRILKEEKINTSRINEHKGYVSKEGYRILRRNSKYVKEHVWLWLQENRPLPKGWYLHHLNGNPLDNRLENLVPLSPKTHRLVHMENQKRDWRGRFINGSK